MDARSTSIEPANRHPYFRQHLRDSKIHIGRAKGTRNKIHASVRYALEQVFTGLGGWEGMLAWAKDNPDVFYGQVIPKLLPTELAESGAGVPIRVLVYAPQAEPQATVRLEETQAEIGTSGPDIK